MVFAYHLSGWVALVGLVAVIVVLILGLTTPAGWCDRILAPVFMTGCIAFVVLGLTWAVLRYTPTVREYREHGGQGVAHSAPPLF
jgi:hypothetical protein